MKKQDLIKIAKNFSKGRVAVLGDFMLDHYVYGQVERISPEAPIPILLAGREEDCPGGAGNTARNAASLGAKVLAFGVIGQDEMGDNLKKQLQQDQIDTTCLLEDENRSTISKSRIIASNQHVVRVDRENGGVISADKEDELIKKIKEKLNNFDVLVFSDYAKGTITKRLVCKLIKLCRKSQKPVIVDTKPVHYLFFEGANLITPNLKEAKEMSGKKDPLAMGKKIKQDIGCNVLLTRSEEGMTLFEDDFVKHFPVEAKEVFDIVGAGDTVVSTVSACLAGGAKLPEAVFLSNCAAGIVVGKQGTSVVEAEELIDFLENKKI